MVLNILGNGVVASVLVKNSKAESVGWVAITAGDCSAVIPVAGPALGAVAALAVRLLGA